MKLVVFLAAVTIAIYVTIGLVAKGYGPEVAARFLERSTHYNAEELKSWIANNPLPASRYSIPILFPLDLLFLIWAHFLRLAQ